MLDNPSCDKIPKIKALLTLSKAPTGYIEQIHTNLMALTNQQNPFGHAECDEIFRTTLLSKRPLCLAISVLFQISNQRRTYDALHCFGQDASYVNASVLTWQIHTTSLKDWHDVMKFPFLWPMTLLEDTAGKNGDRQAEWSCEFAQEKSAESIRSSGLVHS